MTANVLQAPVIANSLEGSPKIPAPMMRLIERPTKSQRLKLRSSLAGAFGKSAPDGFHAWWSAILTRQVRAGKPAAKLKPPSRPADNVRHDGDQSLARTRAPRSERRDPWARDRAARPGRRGPSRDRD